MLINLSEMFDRDGKESDWEAVFEMKEYHDGSSVYPVVSSEPVILHGRNLGNGKLSITGSTSVTLSIPCARCLAPVEYPMNLEFDEEVDMKATKDQRAKDLDEKSYLDGYNLDVDQLVCNELSLCLPMKVLCKEDCKGICNRCGANLNYETCNCDTRSLDPRMAVIQDIFKQFKEV